MHAIRLAMKMQCFLGLGGGRAGNYRGLSGGVLLQSNEVDDITVASQLCCCY